MNVRKYAIDCLEKILDNDGYSNIVINEVFTKYLLNEEDKNLLVKIVYGTLQNLLLLDFYLEPFLKKKPKKHIKYILYSSCYQLVFLNIPDYAVVNEAVNLARIKDKELASFVNGVLRAFIRTPRREIEELKYDEVLYLSVKYSTPKWLVYFLLKDYDEEIVIKILEETIIEKKDVLRINTLKTDKEKVTKILEKENIEYTLLDDFDAIVVYKPLFKHELFKKGYLTIQDLSSQLVSIVTNPKQNSTVLDLCAAPGGKSSHLSALMNNTGKIFSCDIYQHKIKLMNSLFKRLGVTNAITQLVDSREVFNFVLEKSFDIVIADVPCSGLGVISHKVDIKYKITRDSIDTLVKLQKEILEKTYNLVKVKGYLVYSTCTINKEENEYQIKSFLEKHPEFEIVEERKIMPYEIITNGIKGDGFYICKMIRN